MTLHAAMIASITNKILVNIHIYAYYANISYSNIQCCKNDQEQKNKGRGSPYRILP